MKTNFKQFKSVNEAWNIQCASIYVDLINSNQKNMTLVHDDIE